MKKSIILIIAAVAATIAVSLEEEFTRWVYDVCDRPHKHDHEGNKEEGG